jgi:UDP-N-acetylmuramate: L-alanyl-gamma-D-glutamyl-meso-diaminopimelate ligase
MRVHFIAIGGSAMHNLAIALHQKGYRVSGSDDEIFEPSKTRLRNLGLLPETEGWHPGKLDPGIDAVILGMHARNDNPELLQARELGLKIYSYPEYLYEQSKDKIRVVIGGSHGKTTITAMILHVLQHSGIDTDYMVGAQLEGFDVMVRLSENARFMVLEGDEYLSSALDPRPKFHLYRPHIALLSGIAWDHMNVFPTFENYVSQFREFIKKIEPKGKLIYFEEDPVIQSLASEERVDVAKIPYGTLPYMVRDGVTRLLCKGEEVPLSIFGKHNLQNLNGAWLVCNAMGVSEEEFLSAARTFKGASKRLQLLGKGPSTNIYKDFAHSPSKLKATIGAVKELYPERELVACIELHTYSSLNINFLPQYHGCLDLADMPVVYFSPHALQLKKLPQLTTDAVREAFGDPRIRVYNDSSLLRSDLISINFQNKNLLMMSSGDFDGLKLEDLAARLVKGE